MRILVVTVAAAAAVAAAACWYTHPPLPSSIHIWAETNNSFFDHGRSLRRSIARAIHGSDRDIITFIGDSRYTDGAGFYGFGDALVGIAQEVGDERFARILAQLPSDQRGRVWMLFGCGAEYRRQPLSDEELHRQLPRTMQIFDEWKPKT